MRILELFKLTCRPILQLVFACFPATPVLSWVPLYRLIETLCRTYVRIILIVYRLYQGIPTHRHVFTYTFETPTEESTTNSLYFTKTK